MKLLTTTLLIIVGLYACKGQEADTLIYYTQSDIDAITARYEQKLDSCAILIETLQQAIDASSSAVIADTFNFDIADDRIKVSMDKKGHNVYVTIIDGTNRLNTWYVDYDKTVRIMDDTKQVGYIYIDTENENGTTALDLN